MTYSLGQTVELDYTTTPAETGTLVVTRPDGTLGTAVLSGTAGAQAALVDANQAGTWSYVWESPNAGQTAGTFTVGPSLVTLAEVKQHLNITGTRNDVELALYIDAATAVIEDYVGAVVPRQVKDEVVHGNILRESPALTLDTVTYGGVPYTGSYDLNAAAGLLYYVPIGATVTYTVGRTPIPGAIKLAALVVVARLWETQRGSQPLPVGADDTATYVAQGGPDLPYRAQMLLAPYRRGSRVA